jgi:four helix bundle protein
MKNFKNLRIWQNGMEITKMIYELVQSLPKNERFGLINQITRAAVSIPANIAEGSSRESEKDNCRFLQIALGSCFELETLLYISEFVAAREMQNTQTILELLKSEIRMLHSFIKNLKPS